MNDAPRVALLTGPGPAGIAVIGLRGNFEQILARSFRKTGTHIESSHPPQPGTHSLKNVQLGILEEKGEVLDQVLLVRESPQAAEIHCHGGPRVVERILMALKQAGAEIVDWQEFYQGQNLRDEIQLYLPRVASRAGVLRLLAQEEEGLGAWVKNTLQKLNKPDFSAGDFSQLKTDIDNILATYGPAQWLFNPPLVVVTGPVNAGKSSLINALIGSETIIASELPGTTRDWTEHPADMAGLAVILVDTAGIRPPGDEIEKVAQDYARAKLAQADLILFVIEPKTPPEIIQEQLAELPAGKKILKILNKSDLYPLPDNYKQPITPILISATTGQGLDDLRREVAETFGWVHTKGIFIWTQRQKKLLEAVGQTETAGAWANFLANIRQQTGPALQK